MQKRLLLLSTFTLFLWSIVIPIFEGTGEVEHYKVVHYISSHKFLPDIRFLPQAIHPLSLLFYVPVDRLLGTPNMDNLISDSNLNPKRSKRAFLANVWLHKKAELEFHWNYQVLSVHALRLISVLMGIAYMFVIYVVAKNFFLGDKIKILLTSGLTILSPTFTHMFSIITNDAFSSLVAAVAILAIFKLLEKPTLWYAFIVGIIVGLAVSSKLTSLYLVCPSLAAIILTQTSLKYKVKLVILFITSMILATLPYLLINYTRYGHPLALNVFQENNEGFKGAWTKLGPINFLLTYLEIPFVSYWGYVGYTYVAYPGIYLFILYHLTLLAITGVGLRILEWFSQHGQRLSLGQKQTFILCIAAVTFFVKLFILTLDYSSFSGRFLYAVHPAIVLLTITGIDYIVFHLKKRRWKRLDKVWLLLLLPIYCISTVLAFNRQGAVLVAKYLVSYQIIEFMAQILRVLWVPVLWILVVIYFFYTLFWKKGLDGIIGSFQIDKRFVIPLLLYGPFIANWLILFVFIFPRYYFSSVLFLTP